MRRLVLAGAGALVLAASLPASAAVVMSDGRGRVEVLPEGGGRARGILPGEPLSGGTLSVGDGSQAVLATDDGAKLQLAGSARAKISAGQATEVSLEAGTLQAQGGTRKVEVKAASGLVASATGAAFEVALAGDGAVDISDEKGTLQLALDGSTSTLAAGQKLHLEKGDALPAAKAPAKVVDNPFEKPAKPDEKPAEAEKKPEAKPEQVAEAKPEKKPEAKLQKVAAKPEKKPEAKPEKVAMAEQPEQTPDAQGDDASAKGDQPEAKPAKAPKADAPKPDAAPAGPPTLKVKWPSGPVATTFTLRGSTAPGAKVMVNDVAANVRKNGSFSVKLTLDEGENQIAVKATSADGQETSDSHALTAVVPAAKPEGAAAPAGSDKPAVKQEGAGWE